jgi:hypothetical protein
MGMLNVEEAEATKTELKKAVNQWNKDHPEWEESEDTKVV